MLRDENERLQGRLHELEDALRQTLQDDNSGDQDDEAEEETRVERKHSVYRTEGAAVRHTPAREISTPTMSSTKSGQIDCFTVDTLPSVFFYVRPLIEVHDGGTSRLGELSDLAPALLHSL